jgi:hypothetical protein
MLSEPDILQSLMDMKTRTILRRRHDEIEAEMRTAL